MTPNSQSQQISSRARAVWQALRDAFNPLRTRNLRVYLGGQTISLIGTWMQMTAQSWVVWELSRSAAVLGAVAMVGFLPMLLLAPWSGTLIDRLDRRRLLIGTQVAAMALAFTLAALVQTGAVRIWHIYLLSTLLGIVTALDMPAQQAFIGDLSGMHQVRRAVVLNTMIFQVSRTVGPALAGWIVASLGAAVAFWLNGASFLAVVASLMAVEATQVRHTGNGGLSSAFVDGLRFIRGRPRIFDLLLFTLILTFFGISAMSILPAAVGQALRGKADALGLLMASSGAGALVGSVLVTPLAQRIRRVGLVLAAALMWTGLWLAIFSFSTQLGAAMAAMFLGATTFPVVVATANGLIQTLAPADMRGRLLTILLMTSFGAQPFASLAVGFGAQVLGAMAALRINGVLMMGGALVLLALRQGLWGWEGEPVVGREEERQTIPAASPAAQAAEAAPAP